MTIFELLHDNAVADTDLLRKSDSLGDVFTTAREVDFAFETTDGQRASDFAEYVNGKSYGAAAVKEIKVDHFQVLVLITMPITQNPIGCVSGFMVLPQSIVPDRLFGLGISRSEAVVHAEPCPAARLS